MAKHAFLLIDTLEGRCIYPAVMRAVRPHRRHLQTLGMCSMRGHKSWSATIGIMMVGAIGFEPTTLWSQTRCATRLRYTPTAFYSIRIYSQILLGGQTRAGAVVSKYQGLTRRRFHEKLPLRTTLAVPVRPIPACRFCLGQDVTCSWSIGSGSRPDGNAID